MAYVSTDPGYKADLTVGEENMTTEETILSIMKVGGVKASVASALNISLRRLNKWAKDYPELKELLELGETHSHAWWFNQGKTNFNKQTWGSGNHNTWYAIMRNKFGYGDKPSERPACMAEWGGTVMEQLETLNARIRSGDITADQYEHYMKSLLHHTKIYEVVSIAPAIAKMDADRAFKAGDIGKEEYDNKIALIIERQKLLDIASLNLSKKTKIKDDRLPLKQQRKVVKPVTGVENRYNAKKKG